LKQAARISIRARAACSIAARIGPASLPGGGLTLLAFLGVSALAPGWAASALGCTHLHAHLVSWILAQPVPLALTYGALYLATGCVLLIGVILGVGAAILFTMRALFRLLSWAARTGLGLAATLGALLTWPLQLLGEFLWDACSERAVRINVFLEEQRELRRVYREDYAGDFPSYRAFLRDFRARQNGAAQREEVDALAQAIRLMGLPERFTKADLKQRFDFLIKRTHPDLVGPNGLAPQLIAANTLINKRKGWR
jgi:hypothetical protein